MNIVMCLQELGASKAHICCRLKMMQKAYEVPPMCVLYSLQKPFTKELGRLQEQ